MYPINFFNKGNNVLFYFYVPHLRGVGGWVGGEGDTLFLVWIPLSLALVSGLAFALASQFLVCTLSCEPMVGFLPNFHGYYWDIAKNIRPWGGDWVRQRCHVSYVTGASNWYWLTVGQGLLSFFCFFTFIHFPFSPVPPFDLLYYLFYLSSPEPFSGRWHKMTHKVWHVVKP